MMLQITEGVINATLMTTRLQNIRLIKCHRIGTFWIINEKHQYLTFFNNEFTWSDVPSFLMETTMQFEISQDGQITTYNGFLVRFDGNDSYTTESCCEPASVTIEPVEISSFLKCLNIV